MLSHYGVRALRVIALLLGAATAQAGEYYVDALHGDNANTGASEAQAWKTITRALTAVPAQAGTEPEVIHVAPGVYDSVLGEVFPFLLQEHAGVQIVSSAGSAATILDGGGADQILVCVRFHHYGFGGLLTRVEGFTLRNAQSALLMKSAELSLYLTCRDLVISGMGTSGMQFEAGTSFAPGVVNALVENVAITGCPSGIFVLTTTSALTGAHVNLTVKDTTIRHNGGSALRIEDGQAAGTTVVCSRVRMSDNAEGVVIRQQNALGTGALTSTELVDCLISDNAGAGLLATYDGAWMPPYQASSIVTKIHRSTIAHNAGPGLDLFFSTIPASQTQTILEDSIVYGNQDDVRENPAQPSIVGPRFCDIGDGDFAGSNGNIAQAPLFRDSASGDYRLVWGSPCIDRADPAAAPDLLDLLRVQRPVDGDLDAQEVADMGCLEFRPLELVGSAHLGQPLVLEQWGPDGGGARLLLARGQPLAVPISTPQGQLDLDPLLTRSLGRTLLGSGPPVQRVLQIPGAAGYLGQVLSFQALCTSSVAAPKQAYSNVLAIHVVP